jgi:hypothetical protein
MCHEGTSIFPNRSSLQPFSVFNSSKYGNTKLSGGLCFITAAAASTGSGSMGLGGESGWVVELIKISPAIFALLAVIYWMYRIILAKDSTTKELILASQGDIERQSKMLALLEILVHRASKNGGGL